MGWIRPYRKPPWNPPPATGETRGLSGISKASLKRVLAGGSALDGSVGPYPNPPKLARSCMERLINELRSNESIAPTKLVPR